MPRTIRPSAVPAVALLVALLLTVLAATARPAAAATTCTQDWRPAATATFLNADGTPTDPPRPLAPAPRPDDRPFHLFCGGRYVTSVWVASTETPSTVATLGRDVVLTARYPSVRPSVNPALGITGLAAWFWAVADDTPVRMLRGNGMDLDIELRVATVRWRFGDGTTGTVAGWGTPYPTPSPVQHVYERTGAYTIEAQVGLIGRIRGEELDAELPGSHTVTLRHDVAEVRSLLHAD